ncbi:MAG TPA: S9 family peptidase [Kofleriaceae bacterium]|nr:S9 family peptidase [Kofleriaceae bacterium]
MKRFALVAILFGCGSSKPGPVSPTPAPPPVAEATPAPAAPATPPAPPPAVGKPKNDLIPRSVLFGNPERTNVQISPDGKHLSWIAAKDGVLNVFVAAIDKLDEAKPITSETSRPVRQYFWSFDNKHVLYMQDTAGDENWHLIRADLDGKTDDLTPYKGARVEVMGLSEKKPATVIVGINDRNPQLSDVYALDIPSGKRTLLYQNDDGFVGFNLDHELNLVFAEKLVPTGGGEIYIREGKAWKLYDSIPFEDAQTTGIADVLPGGKALVTESRGRDTAALVEQDEKTKKEKVIAEDPKADVGGMMFHPTRHTLLAVSFDYDRVHWRAIDRSVQPDLDGLTKLADGGDFGVSSTSLDFKTWLVATTTPQHPGHYYLWDHVKHTGKFLFAARPELDKQPLVGQEAVVIPARDGLPLVSYLTKPAGATGPVPMVMFVHGGPWARDSYGYSSVVQLFANRGYAVLQVNFRGSTGFGKKFLNAGNLEWAKKMHDDILDGVAWAVDHGVTTKDKVAIAGGSYGGYETLVGLAMTPDEFACGVDLVGPSNLLTLIASVPPYWVPILADFKKRIGDWETPEGKQLLEQASPLTHAADIKRPLLIGQGANDPRVKQAESEQIVAAMKQHGLPVTYIVFPDEGHGFARPVNNIAFFGAAEAFLSAHLGGYYLPLSAEEIKASTMDIKAGREGIPGLP